ncbi:DUF4928 family protein [Gordonia iterans]
MPTPNQVWDTMRPPVETWYESKRKQTGRVNANVMAVGLVIAEYMADGVPMQETSYRAPSQVKRLGGAHIRQILTDYGESRRLTKEGGRTSRGSIVLAGELAPIVSDAAIAAGYASLTDEGQAAVRAALQRWFFERVQVDHFDRQRIKPHISPNNPVRVSIAAVLTTAAAQGGTTAGAVAQHMVGAKLVLRFPDEQIDNHSYTTADDQLGRPGDFFVGDTAIHVTTSPAEAVLEKCRENIDDGYRPMLVVPSGRVAGAQQIADTMGLGTKISIQSVEDFVGTNVEEAGFFRAADIRIRLRSLLEIYRLFELNRATSAVILDAGPLFAGAVESYPAA